MSNHSRMRSIFSIWVILAAIGVGICLLLGSLYLIKAKRPSQSSLQEVTAALTVIPAPTETSPPHTPTPLFSPTPSHTPPPTPLPGDISVGGYVQITGTGGDGLRLRAEPGLDSEVRFLGLEDEVFLVQDGPHNADSYEWWYLVAPFDETRRGWAASNFLQVVQNP